MLVRIKDFCKNSKQFLSVEVKQRFVNMCSIKIDAELPEEIFVKEIHFYVNATRIFWDGFLAGVTACFLVLLIITLIQVR